MHPDGITARIVEYRHFIAQRAQPALFAALQIRPLAVSGVLECPQGLVIGRRAATLTQDAGLWELVPSGGLDPNTAVAGNKADCTAQILIELREETGLEADQVFGLSPFCLIEDDDSHVIDIGIAMATTLDAAQLAQIHRAGASSEYAELGVVPAAEADGAFMGRVPLVAVSQALLSEYRRTRAQAMRP